MTDRSSSSPAAPRIVVTDAAARRLATLAADNGDPCDVLRFAVRPGGCSGFSYLMCFEEARAVDDVVVRPADDSLPFDVVSDPSSVLLVDGATLNFHDTLERSGFAIENPNASRSCGCGQSFS